MELWRGTMTAHSFTVYQSGARGPSISFDLPDWQKCVPISLPSTLCIEERLPAGAACVLINRSHQFHDLVLPLNARQKAVFDRIDGRRAIAEIVENPDDMARGLFEKLWQYDQVVFDASRLFS